MDSVELKISLQDWLYIVIIGALFGFLISVFLYFLHGELQNISTILFSVTTAVFISLYASILITISNNFILPNVNKKFWYLLSFFFSFCSGAFGFLLSFVVFLGFETKIIALIKPYWGYITITIGFLTFLVGLILHQFISMKYKNESIKNEMLQTKLKTLENELNPHFLFNALNSVSELIYIDQHKAETSILNLSKFLRNAIKTESLITIADELKMVQTYVDIENIRFENKILLCIEANQEMNELKIPKFSIQLLVENGIKHGYEMKPLQIDIHCSKGEIEVKNSGKITQNIVFGTGLTNLKKRLELLDIGSLEHTIDDGMKFIIYLKKGKNENTDC